MLMSGVEMQVELAIGEAVFSRTYKCIDTTTDQVVCLKIIKNNKEYFDQGVDEIRVLEYIDHNCKVDERHLVRLLDAFYFREHLVIVTEVRWCAKASVHSSTAACLLVLDLTYSMLSTASSRQSV